MSSTFSRLLNFRGSKTTAEGVEQQPSMAVDSVTDVTMGGPHCRPVIASLAVCRGHWVPCPSSTSSILAHLASLQCRCVLGRPAMAALLNDCVNGGPLLWDSPPSDRGYVMHYGANWHF